MARRIGLRLPVRELAAVPRAYVRPRRRQTMREPCAEDRERWEKNHQHDAANPATVLRLVGMVRWLADNIPGVVRPCAGYSRKCFLGDITKCEGDSDAECWIAAAYIATETRHDQN